MARPTRTVPFLSALAGCLCGLCLWAAAAPLENVYTPVVQPDGTELELYATGDEFFHYLHDEAGRIIVQDNEGWFTYARSEDGVPVASEVVLRPIDGAEVIPMGITSGETMTFDDVDMAGHPELVTSYDLPEDYAPFPVYGKAGGGEVSLLSATPERMANLVVFIRFPGEEEFVSGTAEAPSVPVPEDLQAHYGEAEIDLGARYGMISSYMQKVSHGSFDIVTSFATAPGGDGRHILSAEAPRERAYYQPYSSINPAGYSGDTDRANREMALLATVIGQVSGQVPAHWELDYDGDGYVDNVTFIVSGATGGWADMLWPHSWVLQKYRAEINGKQVYQFNFNFAHPQYAGTGVLSHELLHAVGYPDLYRYSYNGDPVGAWDAMGSTDYADPQFLGAYLKNAYAGWANVDTITRSGDFTLWPIGTDDEKVEGYCIPTEVLGQSIWLEYRKSGAPGNVLEDNVPCDGLLVYRANDLIAEGNRNGDYPGGNDQVYIFRPGDTDYNAGTELHLNKAALSDKLERTKMGSSDRTYRGTDTLYFNDGTNSGVAISNVKVNGDGSISFHVQLTYALDPIEPDKTYQLDTWPGDLLITRPGTYTFTGSTREHRITVDTLPDEAVTIVLDGAEIDLSTMTYAAPITLRAGSRVTVEIPEGAHSKLYAGDYAAGISVTASSVLTVHGPGKLTANGGAGGAGLGADAMGAGGSIVLDGANVAATGGGQFVIIDGIYIIHSGNGGSAIGCGDDTVCGPITIKNSKVDATAGYASAIATSYWGLRTGITEPGGGDISILGGSTVNHQGIIHSGGKLTIENSAIQGAQGPGVADILLTAKQSVTLTGSDVALTNPYRGGLGGSDPNVQVAVNGGSLTVHALTPIQLSGTADTVDGLVTISGDAQVLLTSTGDTPILWGYADSTGTERLYGNTKGDGVLLQGGVASSGRALLLRLLKQEGSAWKTRSAFVLTAGTKSAAFTVPGTGTYRLQDELEQESGPLGASNTGVNVVGGITFTPPGYPGEVRHDMAGGPLAITASGRYTVTGSTATAGITVSPGCTVQLVLDGVDITAPEGQAALAVGDGATVLLTVRARTANRLTGNGRPAIDAPNAVLTMDGSGSLLAAGGAGQPGITTHTFTVDQYTALTATGGAGAPAALTRKIDPSIAWTPDNGLEPTVLSVALREALTAGKVLTVLGPESTETVTLTVPASSLFLAQRTRGEYRLRLSDGAVSGPLSCERAYNDFTDVVLVREDADAVPVALQELTGDLIIDRDGTYVLSGEVREGVRIYVRSGVFARIVFDTATLHCPDDDSDPYNKKNRHAICLEGNCDVTFELRGRDNHITVGSSNDMYAVALSPTAHLAVEAGTDDGELHLIGGIGTIVPEARFGQFVLRSGDLFISIGGGGGNYTMSTVGGSGATVDISGGSITTVLGSGGEFYGGPVGGPGSRVTVSGGKLNMLKDGTQTGLVGGENAQVIISGGEVYAPEANLGIVVGGKNAAVLMTGGSITTHCNHATSVGGDGSNVRLLGGSVYAAHEQTIGSTMYTGNLGGTGASMDIAPEARVCVFFPQTSQTQTDAVFRGGTSFVRRPAMFLGWLRPLDQWGNAEQEITLYFLHEDGLTKVPVILPDGAFWDPKHPEYDQTGAFFATLPKAGTYKLYRDMGTGDPADDLYGGTYPVVENEITRVTDITFGRLEKLTLSDTTVTYNGGYQTLTAEGLEECPGVTVTYANNRQSEPGTYPVTAHVVPAEAPDGSNHLPYDLTATFTIEKAPLTITAATPQNKLVYDGTGATTGTFTYSGAVAGQRPAVQGTFTMKGAGVGSHSVDITNIHLDGVWDSRYALTPIDPALLTGLTASVVEKAPAVLAFTPEDLSQAVGQIKPVRVTASSNIEPDGIIHDPVITITYGGSSALPTAQGQYPVKAVLDHQNYKGEISGTLNVGQSWNIGENDINIVDGGIYRITGDTSAHKITVGAISGDVNLVLDGVTIDLSGISGAVPITVAKSFQNGPGPKVTITAATGSSNVLKAGDGASAVVYTGSEDYSTSNDIRAGILFGGTGTLDVYGGGSAPALDGRRGDAYYWHEMAAGCLDTRFYSRAEQAVNYTNTKSGTSGDTSVKLRLSFASAPTDDTAFTLRQGGAAYPFTLPKGYASVFLLAPFVPNSSGEILDAEGAIIKTVQWAITGNSDDPFKNLPLKAERAEGNYDLGAATGPIALSTSGTYTFTGSTSANTRTITVAKGVAAELIFDGITVNQTGENPFLTAEKNTQVIITLRGENTVNNTAEPASSAVRRLFYSDGPILLQEDPSVGGKMNAAMAKGSVLECGALTVTGGEYVLSAAGDKVRCLGSLRTDIRGGIFDLTVNSRASGSSTGRASAIGRDGGTGGLEISGGDFTFHVINPASPGMLEHGPVYCIATSGDVTLSGGTFRGAIDATLGGFIYAAHTVDEGGHIAIGPNTSIAIIQQRMIGSEAEPAGLLEGTLVPYEGYTSLLLDARFASGQLSTRYGEYDLTWSSPDHPGKGAVLSLPEWENSNGYRGVLVTLPGPGAWRADKPAIPGIVFGGEAGYLVTTIPNAGYQQVAGLAFRQMTQGEATLEDKTYPYDGQPKSLAVSGAPSGASVTYDGNGRTEPGTYPVTATVTLDGYSFPPLSATLTITKAPLVVTALADDKPVYDGTPDTTGTVSLFAHPVTGEGVPSSLAAEAAFRFTNCDVGQYKEVRFDSLTWEGEIPDFWENHFALPKQGEGQTLAQALKAYAGITTASITDPAPATLSFVPTTLAQTEDGDPKPVSCITSGLPDGAGGFAAVDYEVLYTVGGVQTTDAPSAAGSYPVTARLTDGNYTAPDITDRLVIRAAEITGVTLEDAAVPYDGQPHRLVPQGLQEGDSVEYSATPRDAGVHDITAVVHRAGCRDLTLTARLTIEPKAVTITGVQVPSIRPSDELNLEVTGSTGFDRAASGILGGDEVFLNYKAAYPDPDPGEKEVALSECALSGADAGNYAPVFPGSGVGLVTDRVLTSIAVTTPPDKLDYLVGEHFDPAGMVVTALYEDGSEHPAAGVTWTPDTFTQAGDAVAVTLSYTEGGVPRSCELTVTVAEPPALLQSIAVTTPPDKTDYLVEEPFDPAGMEVTAFYDDGSEHPAAGYSWTPQVFTQAGDAVAVTLSYTDGDVTRRCSLTVTVEAPAAVLASVRVTNPPDKTDYYVGESLDPAGMEVTASYSDGAERPIDPAECIVTPTRFDAAGTVTVTVAYTEDGLTRSGTFPVTVTEPPVEAPVLTGLELVPPARTSYTQGDSLDTAGMTVTALYSDGSKRVLATGWTCSPTALDSAGTITVTVSYTEEEVTKSAAFSITVAPSGGGGGGGSGGGGGGSSAVPIKPTEPAKEEEEPQAEPQYPDPGEVELPFADLSSHWAREDIAYVCVRGLLKGTEEDRFAPDIPMSRAMFVTVLGRLAEVDPGQYHDRAFEDVPPGDWYGPYVAWAKAQGLVSGRSGQTFAPDEPITRQEMAVLMARYIQYARLELPGGQSGQFTDAPAIASWAYDAVDKVQQAGLMRGDPDGSFSPNRSTTRAETAAVLRRLLEQIEGVEQSD